MSGFGDLNLNLAIKETVFNQIGRYVLLCCNIMSNDLQQNKIKLENNENIIRNYLLEKYLDDSLIRRKYKMNLFHFIPEAQENFDKKKISYKGRVDVKIVKRDEWFENNNAAYFIECKRIDGKKRLNEEYVKNGVARFVVKPILYKSFYKKNYMLGFVVNKINIYKLAKKQWNK